MRSTEVLRKWENTRGIALPWSDPSNGLRDPNEMKGTQLQPIRICFADSSSLSITRFTGANSKFHWKKLNGYTSNRTDTLPADVQSLISHTVNFEYSINFSSRIKSWKK